MAMENNTDGKKMAEKLDEFADMIMTGANSHFPDPPGSRLWVITVDSHPMPYEINQWPYRVTFGSEGYVKKIVQKLNAKKGQTLYEYSECSNNRILFENVEMDNGE